MTSNENLETVAERLEARAMTQSNEGFKPDTQPAPPTGFYVPNRILPPPPEPATSDPIQRPDSATGPAARGAEGGVQILQDARPPPGMA